MLISHGKNFQHQTPVALTIGNFDGLHLGHQAMLAALKRGAAERGLPSCVVTFEPHPREYFAPHAAPARLTPLRDKLSLLRDLGIEQVHVLPFDRQLASMPATRFGEEVLSRGLGARLVIIGDDFRFGADRAGDHALLTAQSGRLGFDVQAMPSVLVEGLRVSSTAIRGLLAAGQLKQAGRLLGRPFTISGRVFHGDKLGRTLGYPTANLYTRNRKLPLSGIYVVQVRNEAGEILPGVASIGTRPTVKSGTQELVEVYLLDFSGFLYGQRLCVELVHKLRDEQKFDSLGALVQQIELDVAETRAWFARAAHD